MENFTLGNGIGGSLTAIVDPGNPSMQVNASESKDSGGLHVLDYDLFSKRQTNQITEQELQNALDSAK